MGEAAQRPLPEVPQGLSLPVSIQARLKGNFPAKASSRQQAREALTVVAEERYLSCLTLTEVVPKDAVWTSKKSLRT